MFFKESNQQKDDAALELTRSSVNLSGIWFAHCLVGGQEIASSVRIRQTGCAVFGTLVGKLASSDILIRGVVFESQLIANYWQPNPPVYGSGLLNLRLSNNGQILVGIGSWNSEDGSQEAYEWRWERTQAAQP
jgi:hypothetical protein